MKDINKKYIRATLFCLIILSLIICLASCMTVEEYTVTFVLDDERENITTTVDSVTKLYTPEPPTGTNLVFAGWFTNPERTRPYMKAYADSDMTLYARFVPYGEYVVTYIYENGEPTTTVAMTGKHLAPKDPTRAGYIFAGWRDAASGDLYKFGKVPSDSSIILIANWQLKSGDITLKLNYNNGEGQKVENYKYNQTPNKPTAPTYEDHIFLGWYLDADCETPFDWTKPLTHDTEIYAGFRKDASVAGNEVAEKMLKAVMKIYNDNSTKPCIGSGVIYKQVGTKYYVLTNYHVTENGSSGTFFSDFSVSDTYGNKYKAQLEKRNATYDLAVLSFTGSTDISLGVVSLAAENAVTNTDIIAIGNPGGVINSVTYGTLGEYSTEVFSGSQVTFAVGHHTAPMDSGSSGGALFNYDMELVGINYAVSKSTSTGEFVAGLFIPIEKVREFLT